MRFPRLERTLLAFLLALCILPAGSVPIFAAGNLTVEFNDGGTVTVGNHTIASGESFQVSEDAVNVTLSPADGYQIFSVYKNTGPDGEQVSEDMGITDNAEKTVCVPVSTEDTRLQIVFLATEIVESATGPAPAEEPLDPVPETPNDNTMIIRPDTSTDLTLEDTPLTQDDNGLGSLDSDSELHINVRTVAIVGAVIAACAVTCCIMVRIFRKAHVADEN